MQVTIGAVVDFISDNARRRGVVHFIEGGLAFVPVIGEPTMYAVPVDKCVPVKEQDAFVDILRDVNASLDRIAAIGERVLK